MHRIDSLPSCKEKYIIYFKILYCSIGLVYQVRLQAFRRLGRQAISLQYPTVSFCQKLLKTLCFYRLHKDDKFQKKTEENATNVSP